jgi:hypothetical protein
VAERAGKKAIFLCNAAVEQRVANAQAAPLPNALAKTNYLHHF